MSTLEKARFYLNDNGAEKDVFYVQFNPNSLRYSAQEKSGRKKRGRINAQIQDDATGQTGSSVLSMTLYFYTYRSDTDYDDVRKSINKLRTYMGQDAENGTVINKKINFAWGTISMEGYLQSMEVSYQMFAPRGTPVQAEVSITMVGEDPEVRAAAINHAKEVKLKLEAAASWDQKKDGSDPAEEDMGIAWLFEGA